MTHLQPMSVAHHLRMPMLLIQGHVQASAMPDLEKELVRTWPAFVRDLTKYLSEADRHIQQSRSAWNKHLKDLFPMLVIARYELEQLRHWTQFFMLGRTPIPPPVIDMASRLAEAGQKIRIAMELRDPRRGRRKPGRPRLDTEPLDALVRQARGAGRHPAEIARDFQMPPEEVTRSMDRDRKRRRPIRKNTPSSA